MENREYFFHKRKSMAQREGKSMENMDDEISDQKFNYIPPKSQQSNYVNKRRNNYPSSQVNKNFFDKISSSCAEDDKVQE
jgi:hypothetical protein